MKRILLITIGDQHTASTRYRVMQYLPFLKERGYETVWIQRDQVSGLTSGTMGPFDVIFNQKCLLSCAMSRSLLSDNKGAGVLFDFDDAIYTRPGRPYSLVTRIRVRRRLGFWLYRSGAVTVANGVLADFARRYSDRVMVIPMSLDLDEWRPKRGPKDRGHFSIGWIGSPGNLTYLHSIEGALCKLLSGSDVIRLKVFCGKRPFLPFPFEYHPYTPGGEVEFCRSLDAGLLPLKDDEYLRGKSPIKAIQYLACGVPVVGNVIGATSEILNEENSISVSSDEQWAQAIEVLASNPKLAEELGRNGRSLVEQRHDLKRNARVLIEVLETITKDGKGTCVDT